MPHPSAGRRDREVLIEQLSDGAGTSGYPVETWTPLTTEWMEKVATSGGERFVAAQNAAQVLQTWRMAWRDDLDPDAVDVQKTRRLVYQGRVHDITSVVEIGRRQGIELQTRASSQVAA